MKTAWIIVLVLVGCGRQQVTLNGHDYSEAEIAEANDWLGSDCLPDLEFHSQAELWQLYGFEPKPGQPELAGFYLHGVAHVAASSPDIPLWTLRHTKIVHEYAHHVSLCRGDSVDPNHEIARDLWLRSAEYR